MTYIRSTSCVSILNIFLENHIMRNKLTVTALSKEGVRDNFLFSSLIKPVVGKGKRNHSPPSYMLCLEKHEIGLKKSASFFFHLSPGFTSLGKNDLMSLNIELEGY